MTDTQYLMGWGIYLVGALGCLLSLWLLVRKWPIRAKRPLMMASAILMLLPGTVLTEQAEQTFLAPALMASIYDSLSFGADAFWRNGLFVVIATSIAFIAGLLLPVRNNKVIHAELLPEEYSAPHCPPQPGAGDRH